LQPLNLAEDNFNKQFNKAMRALMPFSFVFFSTSILKNLENLWRMQKGLHSLGSRRSLVRFQPNRKICSSVWLEQRKKIFSLPCRQIISYNYCRVKVRVFLLLTNLWKRSLIGRAGKISKCRSTHEVSAIYALDHTRASAKLSFTECKSCPK
jgi:hypothetical protein